MAVLLSLAALGSLTNVSKAAVAANGFPSGKCSPHVSHTEILCGRVTKPSEGFIMAYLIAFLDEVEHNLRVFLYTTEASAASECESGTLF